MGIDVNTIEENFDEKLEGPQGYDVDSGDDDDSVGNDKRRKTGRSRANT